MPYKLVLNIHTFNIRWALASATDLCIIMIAGLGPAYKASGKILRVTIRGNFGLQTVSPVEVTLTKVLIFCTSLSVIGPIDTSA